MESGDQDDDPADLRPSRQGLVERGIGCENGVINVPSWDTAWLEYRHAMLWNFYIVWLTTLTIFYGFKIVLLNMLRTSTALEDPDILTLTRTFL